VNALDSAASLVGDLDPVRLSGRIARVVGLVAEAEGIALPVGALCEIGPDRVRAECVGFRDDRALLMPLGVTRGLRRNDPVVGVPGGDTVPAGPDLLGRVLDALGDPIDGLPAPAPSPRAAVHSRAPAPLSRARIHEPLPVGVRAIDAFATLGAGQRLGLFSGSGVGKSLLMGMITRNTAADVVVVALVGERGREVRDFIERDLGPDGLRRAVVVVATGDEPALLRARAPFTATAIAEAFRDRGARVLLLMDSITRMASALREIGVAAGEPPATRGYPPSMYAAMPRLLERAGRVDGGSVTGIYTVLVEGDDINEPVADTARSILDGHVWLSRDLAQRGHYPAVDVLGSVSRLMIDVTSPGHRAAAHRVRGLLAAHRDAQDLIAIGAYQKGARPDVDRAIALMDPILALLRQSLDDRAPFETTVAALRAIADKA
jgi:FliI/YscN family ATPase